jgi:alkylated DNA repair dioxygenase AlkB
MSLPSGDPVLFAPTGPDGFAYRDNFITPAEERVLLDAITTLQFAPVVMRGAVAKRRTAHFGWTYGYYARRSEPGPPLPGFLLAARARSAAWAGIDAESFVEALVTEYPPGATIGWHRDAPVFGDVVAGLSLSTACRMKFRPYVSPSAVRTADGPRRTTHEVELAPRSGYLLAGAARRDFEHSIPAVAATRYSITFRTLRARP